MITSCFSALLRGSEANVNTLPQMRRQKRVKLESSEKECRLPGCDKADFSALSSRSGLQLFYSNFVGGGQLSPTFHARPSIQLHGPSTKLNCGSSPRSTYNA